MSGLPRAQLGELVQLAVDAGAAAGASVTFRVTLVPGGEEVATLEAPVQDGVARVAWQVEVNGRDLPQTLAFTAELGPASAQADLLLVDPPGRLGTVALRPIPDPPEVGPGQLGPLVLGLPETAIPPAFGEPAAEEVVAWAVCVDLAGPDGLALEGPFALRFLLEEEATAGEGDFAVIEEMIREASGDGAAHSVHAKFQNPAPTGLFRGKRRRFRVRWQRRPHETAPVSTSPDEAVSGVL